jgi:hypothetical protein
MFPTLLDPKNFYLILSQLHSSEIQDLSRRLDGLLHIHPNNPTGHFRLNLENENDRVVCEKLLLLTQCDNGARWRQLRLDNRPLAFARLAADFDAITSGLLQVNFVAGLAVHPTEPVVPDDEYALILERFTAAALQRTRETPVELSNMSLQSVAQAVATSNYGEVKLLKELRWLSNYSVWSTAQVIQLVQTFGSNERKAAVAIVCLNRTVDGAQGYWKVLKEIGTDAQHMVTDMVGWARVFNIKHPEFTYRLDLSNSEERSVMVELCRLSQRFTKEQSANVKAKCHLHGATINSKPMQDDLIFDRAAFCRIPSPLPSQRTPHRTSRCVVAHDAVHSPFRYLTFSALFCIRRRFAARSIPRQGAIHVRLST